MSSTALPVPGATPLPPATSRATGPWLRWGWVAVGAAAALVLAWMHRHPGAPGAAAWLAFAAVLAAAAWQWHGLAALTLRPGHRAAAIAIPLYFGATMLFAVEALCTGLAVPQVLLPAPSRVLATCVGEWPTLAADFEQTVLKAVIPGGIAGSLLGMATAIACDRYAFLRRGLLPLGDFVSALPVIGIAPILVMWLGFDWPSKAAVALVVTYFPALVHTAAGLASTGRMERDLMRSYAASHWQTLVWLKLPAALPFVFTGLKLNVTLALIGAIVAEFFGTPIVGMGFRMSASLGRMAMDMVWAEILLAAATGMGLWGLIALAERALTFWHPSHRRAPAG